MKRLSWLLALAVAAPALVACGDDDDGSAAHEDGGPGDGKAGTGGTTDAGGGTGGSAMLGGTGGAAAVSVQCGDKTCMGSALTAGFINACCADEATGTCGTSIVGGGCMAMAESDPRCPSLNVGGFIMAASCCTDDNQCGISGTTFGAGCVSLQGFGNGMQGFGGFLPAPQTCDGSSSGDAGVESDAGN
jgi:hypothetical protein